MKIAGHTMGTPKSPVRMTFLMLPSAFATVSPRTSLWKVVDFVVPKRAI